MFPRHMPRGVLISVLAVFVFLLFVPLPGSNFLVDLSTEVIIYMLFAISLNVLIGFSGDVSFGHAAYFAIGGYTCAILLTTYHWPLIAAFPAAIVLSALCAAFVAYFCTQLTDIYFAMLTLAFSMFVWSVAFKWRSLTGGDDGFVGVTMPAFLDSRVPFFYFALAVVMISIAALWIICHSSFGMTLAAVRENRTRAGFVGVNTRVIRWAAFVVAGTFAGVAGALFAMYKHGVYTESANWTESALVLIMTLVGGIYSFFGPAVGAAVMHLLDVFTNQYTGYWPTVMGVILLAIVLFLPEGLAGLAKRVRSVIARRG